MIRINGGREGRISVIGALNRHTIRVLFDAVVRAVIVALDLSEVVTADEDAVRFLASLDPARCAIVVFPIRGSRCGSSGRPGGSERLTTHRRFARKASLSMPRRRMRDSRVLDGTPRASAAPSGPEIRPRLVRQSRLDLSVRSASVAAAVTPRCRRRGSKTMDLEVRDAEDISAGQDHGALDDVLELADVAGPGRRPRAPPPPRASDACRIGLPIFRP